MSPYWKPVAEEHTLEGLEAVASLYNERLLDGFTLDEPSFDAWLRVERARLSELAMRALERLPARRHGRAVPGGRSAPR